MNSAQLQTTEMSVQTHEKNFSSLRGRFIALITIIFVTVTIGSGIMFQQLTDIRKTMEDSRILNQKMHFFHQLNHAAVMVASPQTDKNGLAHIAHEIEKDRELIDQVSGEEQTLTATVLSELENPSSHGERISAIIPILNAIHRAYDGAVRNDDREFVNRIQSVSQILILTAVACFVLVSIPALLLMGSIISGLNKLQEKIESANSGEDPRSVAIDRNDEIRRVSDTFDTLYESEQEREIERRINHHFLAEQEKLTAVVNLIGGLAHEVGNPLSTAVAQLELIDDKRHSACGLDCPIESDLSSSFEGVKNSVLRIESLLRQITAFQQRNDDGNESILVNELVESIFRMVQIDERAKGTRFTLDLSPSLPAIISPIPISRLSLAVFSVLTAITNTVEGSPKNVTLGTSLDANEGVIAIRVLAGDIHTGPGASGGDPSTNLLLTRGLLVENAGDLRPISCENGMEGWEIILPTVTVGTNPTKGSPTQEGAMQ